MKKIYIGIFLCLLSNLKVKSQLYNINTFSENTFPKTPEAASFSKFIDIPANSFTGTVNISIPIYDIQFDGKSFPITLEYNTSGIKLDEIASRVGLGWNLSLGGVHMSKQVMGHPDRETAFKHILDYSFDPNDANRNSHIMIDIMGEAPNYSPEIPTSGDISRNDVEPDIYTYSTLQGNGKFVWDFRKNEILTFPHRNFKNTSNRYVLNFLEEDGTEYEFQHLKNVVYNRNSCSNSYFNETDLQGEINLKKIVSSSKQESITFEYTQGISTGQNIKYYISTSEKKKLYSSTPNYQFPVSLFNVCHTYNINNIQFGNRINKLNFKGGYIEFIYSNTYNNTFREDIEGDVYLKRILVKNNDGTVLKDYELEMTFTTSDDEINATYLNTPENYNLKKRMFLTKVIDKVLNTNYILDYYEGNISPRLNNSKDYWGVYNGSNNSSSIGKVKYGNIEYEFGENLLPNLEYAKRGNLKRITYPTKGFMEIEYELDQFFVPIWLRDEYISKGFNLINNVVNSGTIRVRKLELNDLNNGRITKEYLYINPRTNLSSGINYGSHVVYNFNSDILLTGRSAASQNNIRYTYATNNPGWQLNTLGGKSIGYSHVKENIINHNDSQKNYSIDYEYNNNIEDDEFGYEDDYSFSPYNSINLNYHVFKPERGLLINKVYNNNLQKKVRKESFIYEFDDYHNINSSFYEQLEIPILFNGAHFKYDYEVCIPTPKPDIFNPDAGTLCSKTYDYFIFPFKTQWVKNKKNISTEYFSNDETITTTENIYSPSYKHLYPSSTITHNSKGETITTEYKYPADLASNTNSIWDKMVERNMIATPVETKVSNNTTVLSEQRTKFNYYPGTNNTQLILPQYVYTKKGAMGTDVNIDDRKITYNSYDNQGNLTQYTVENGIPVSIIWGYNGQYPIAKIEGASFDLVSSFENDLKIASNSNSLTKTSFDALRNAFPNALVTGYIYKPLVGVTMIIQPNGIAEHYKYDAANRLQEIKNDQGEVLKKFEYNYAQPQ